MGLFIVTVLPAGASAAFTDLSSSSGRRLGDCCYRRRSQRCHRLSLHGEQRSIVETGSSLLFYSQFKSLLFNTHFADI